jgi:hypothetical protein
MSGNAEEDALAELLRAAHTRRLWPGFFGMFLGDYSPGAGAFYWVPDSESLDAALEAIRALLPEADDDEWWLYTRRGDVASVVNPN